MALAPDPVAPAPVAPAAPVATLPAAEVTRVDWTPEAVREAPDPAAAAMVVTGEEARTARRTSCLKENILAAEVLMLRSDEAWTRSRGELIKRVYRDIWLMIRADLEDR